MVECVAEKTRKRRLDPEQEEDQTQNRAAKKPKNELRHRYSKRFWDSLSHVRLTRRALEEFDCRCVQRAITESAAFPRAYTKRLLRSDSRRLTALASKGGPDLTGIRGYSSNVAQIGKCVKMSQSSSYSRKRSLDSKNSLTGKGKTTTPYSGEFEQKLIDVSVYPNGYRIAEEERPPKPENFDDLISALAKPRPSLSPSQVSEKVFEDFQDLNQRASSEAKAMGHIIPMIVGEQNKHLERSGDIPFTRLKKFHEELSAPNPDRYYGAKPAQIDLCVRQALDEYITPSNRTTLPAVPNFFLEGKNAAGRPDIVQRQAMYDGAIGARGMLYLQNYGSALLAYDRNAYSLSATYSDGQLKIYATHPRQSQTHENRTDYYMTQLRAYAMTDTSESFYQGATAFRNARDWAKEQRDLFIANANAIVQRRSADTRSITVSKNTQPSVNNKDDEGSTDSDTSMDELALKYDQKRLKKRHNPHVER